MPRYIATFHSHFGAMTYQKALAKQGLSPKPMPTPRGVSASCGTCVAYENSHPIEMDGCELDSIYLHTGDGYVCMKKTAG